MSDTDLLFLAYEALRRWECDPDVAAGLETERVLLDAVREMERWHPEFIAREARPVVT